MVFPYIKNLCNISNIRSILEKNFKGLLMILRVIKKFLFKEEYREMDLLRKRNERLHDENQSLWDMLEEIKASDVKFHNMSSEIDTILERTKDRIVKSVEIVKTVSRANKKETQ